MGTPQPNVRSANPKINFVPTAPRNAQLKACPERSEGRRLGEYASPEGLIASFRACPERSEGTRAIAARSGARGDCRAAAVVDRSLMPTLERACQCPNAEPTFPI